MENGIGKRIDECLGKINEHDAENAFIQLSIAIDGTSKLAYPQISSSAKRNKQFIIDNMPFVLWSLVNGTPTDCKSMTFQMEEDNKKISFEDVMYKLLRCTLLHEGNMPDMVEFVEDEYIANVDGKIILPVAIISAYCWAIIAHPVNKSARLEKNYKMQLQGSLTQYNLNNCWGNEVKLRNIIRKGFSYDVEKILQQMNSK